MPKSLDLGEARAVRGKAAGDNVLTERKGGALAPLTVSDLDGDEAQKLLRQLWSWYYWERERQSQNRLEMAVDADMYDGDQWDAEDKAIVEERGQMALVYNETAPMVDWMIGTERRARVDWKVLPRTEDDVKLADVKTKVLKYVSDVNRIPFNRSRAFADAIKVGVGWTDCGVRDDPTTDTLYQRYEDWRNVLWDSTSYEPDLSDGRYVFRWRWVDEDLARLMFPGREHIIDASVAESDMYGVLDDEAEDGSAFGAAHAFGSETIGARRASGVGSSVDAHRRRVRLIEAQFRRPAMVKIVADGPFRGAILTPRDKVLADAVGRAGVSIMDRVMMRVHCAVFCEGGLLGMGPSVARHNRYGLTPIWCYRRGRDRLPYGVIRRIRDIQHDLNKRASKALFYLNSNQVVMDEGAVEDIHEARDEASRPDGLIVKKAGKSLEIKRDTDAATGQIQMMAMDAQSIQKLAGVADENLGRQTNAVSGEAIRARQQQGSVVMTEPFDNLRLATQVEGEKLLSLVEQWYTEAKVIRLTGARGAIEWVKINQPEVGPDGVQRFLNDLTASMADFIVSEQDYAGTLRQVMFDSLNAIAQKLPPEVALRMLTLAYEFSDLPNKDEIADQIRKMTGDRDPNKEPTPEEAAQLEQQAQQQAEALELQRQTALAALEEQRAKVREINARAAKFEAEASAAGQGDGTDPAAQQALMDQVRQVQEQAAAEIDSLSEALRKAQSELTNRTLQINRDADVKLQLADIDRDTKLRVAEISKVADDQLAALVKRIEALQDALEKRIEKVHADAKEAAAAKPDPAPAPAPAAAAPAPAPVAPMTINVQVDAKGGPVTKTVTLERGPDGTVKGAKVDEAPEDAAKQQPAKPN